MRQVESAFIKGLGLTDDDIKAIEGVGDDGKIKNDKDEMIDFDFKPLVEKVTTANKNKILNDAEFYNTLPAEKIPEALKKTIESGQYQRFINEIQEVAEKELGLKKGEDFTDDDAKKLKHIVKVISTKYAQKNAGTEGAKELQLKLQEALQKNAQTEGSMAQKIQEALNGEKETTGKHMEKLLGIMALSNLPEIKVKPQYLVDGALAAIRKDYTIKVDPTTMELVLKQKKNPELDAIDGAGKTLTFDDVLAEVAKKENWMDEKADEGGDGGESGKSGKTKVEVDGETAIPQYIKDKMGKDKEK